MCDNCAMFDRKIERLKQLVVQLSDFDEELAARAIFEVVKFRKMKTILHSSTPADCGKQ